MLLKKYSSLPSNYFMNELFNELFHENITPASKIIYPKYDVIENDVEYIVDLSLPGIPKENIKIEIEKNMLSINAERKENIDLNYNRKESYFGKYEKSIRLPDSVDIDNIKASFIDGILQITIAKLSNEKLNKKIIEIV